MVSVEAAGGDPDMWPAADAGAADIPYAATSPHLHQLLRRHRWWSVEAYRAWLAP